MTQPDQPPTSGAVLSLPLWVWGHNAQGLADACRWRLEPTGDSGRWRFTLAERSGGSTPPMLHVERLVDRYRGDTPTAMRRLKQLAPTDVHLGPDLPKRAADELARLDAAHPGDVGTWLYGAALITQAAPDDQLRDVILAVVRGRLQPNHLPDAAAYLLVVDQALSYRFSLTRALLQIADDPGLLERPPEEFLGFNSARALFSDTTFGLDAYLGPLLTSLTPWIWGITAPRAGAVIIYTFGRAISGRRGSASDPLDLLLPRDQLGAGPPQPSIGPRQIGQTLTWWAKQLSELFTEVTDPGNYVHVNGNYQPRKAFERLLSVEQAFRHVQVLSASDRDSHTRRVLLFQTLDTLEGLRLLDFKQMCTLSRAQAELMDLEHMLPPDVASVLLPRARRAVEALKELQRGFFLPSRVSGDGVRVTGKHGEHVMPLEAAVVAWLRLVRNAQHGFGGNVEFPGRDDVLLASHDGEVPRYLSDLAWLYLLRVVAHPSLLRRRVR